MLFEETIQVRLLLASRHVNAGETQQIERSTKSTIVQSQAKKAADRPRGLDKAGTAVGQRPLAWVQPTVEEGDEIEEYKGRNRDTEGSHARERDSQGKRRLVAKHVVLGLVLGPKVISRSFLPVGLFFSILGSCLHGPIFRSRY